MKDLAESLRKWVDAGIIDEDQAASIRSLESTPETDEGIPLVAEVLGYLGGILALVAIFVVVGDAWDEIGSWTRVALVAVGTLVFLVGGWLTRSNELAAIRRLSSFLWVLGVIGTAYTFGLFASEIVETSEEAAVLVGSIPGLLVALALYAITQHSLQQLMVGAAAVISTVSVIVQFDDPPEILYGLAVWILGLLWLFLGWRDRLPPQPTAFALGSIALLAGPQLMFMESWSLLLGIACAGGLLVASVAIRDTVLLGLGAAGVFLFAPQIIFEFFGETLGAPLALFVAGLVLIGVAILFARLRSEVVSGEEGSQDIS